MSSGMLGAGCDGRGWGMHTCDELEGLGLGLLVGHGCCVSGRLRVGCGFNGRRSVGGDEVKLVWRWFDCAPAPGGACPISGSAFSRTTSKLWWLDVFCDVWTLLQQRYPTNTTTPLQTTPFQPDKMFKITRAMAMQPTRMMAMRQSPQMYMRQTARMMKPVPVSI